MLIDLDGLFHQFRDNITELLMKIDPQLNSRNLEKNIEQARWLTFTKENTFSVGYSNLNVRTVQATYAIGIKGAASDNGFKTARE